MTRSDRGSASVELAVLTPVLLVVLALFVAAARLATGHAALDHAATSAARAASLARTPSAAHATAHTASTDSLAAQDLHCRHTTLDLDTSGLTSPAGTVGQVRARVSCTVALADLTLPGLPGHVVLRSEFTSPVDPYRTRALGCTNPDAAVSAEV